MLQSPRSRPRLRALYRPVTAADYTLPIPLTSAAVSAPAPRYAVPASADPHAVVDACAALGLDAFVGKLHLTPRPGNAVKGMNPAQAIILQLMQMVQNNEDVPKIEAVLKRDPNFADAAQRANSLRARGSQSSMRADDDL